MSARRRSVSHARVSVVVPVYNEEAVLSELRDRLRSVLEDSVASFEVILVDDGSSDQSPTLIDQMHAEDPRFCSVRLSRNFGHQAAVTAGLRYATGEVTVVMDADLQDPPEVLPSLLAEWEKGTDVVYAVRRNRKENFLKVALYNLFYRLMGHLSVVPMPLDAGDFCLLSRVALDEINALPEKQRFVRGLRAWVGFRQAGVKYDREARQGGESKYGFGGLLRLAMNGIVSFSDKPLLYLTGGGGLIAALAFVYAGYLIARRIFFGGVITGYASLMAGMLFLSGVQLVSLGLVGIYVSKIFQEVKNRPTFIVNGTRGLQDPQGRASQNVSEADTTVDSNSLKKDEGTDDEG